MRRIVNVRLVIVSEATADEVAVAAQEMLGHSLPGLDGSLVWEAHVSEERTAAPARLATSLEPIPGIVRSANAHDPECECVICEES